MRSVVFRTPGKLDLRALTVFGLNAKPNSSNPIGYFGTGLKYAIAVCCRNKLPITIWIGKTKWVIKATDTNFRGKEFQAIQLTRHTKLFGTKTRDLPFTTELGKTWELWQAFRELYANTLDEDGQTYITEVIGETFFPTQNHLSDKGDTCIIVGEEPFVQEFLEREKTFLPDALRQQHTSEPCQKFDRPSKHVYWRGMRIMDLKDPSQYTWNILSPIEITEDRTVKYEFEVKKAIENYIRNYATKEEVKKTITAPPGTYEHKLDYDYHWSSPSKTFIETVKSVPKKEVTAGAIKHAAGYDDTLKEEKLPACSHDEIIPELIKAIQAGDFSRVEEVINVDRDYVIKTLTSGHELEEAANSTVNEELEPIEPEPEHDLEPTRDDEDTIPF